MKSLNAIFYIIICSLLYISCNSNNKVVDEKIQSQILESGVDFPGKIPIENQIFDFQFFPEKYTIDDIDDFFRNEVPKFKDETYYSNLKGLVYDVLLTNYIGTESKNEALVLYYFNEIEKEPFFYAFKKYLDGLKKTEGLFEKSEVERLAKSRLDKNIQYINKKFVNNDNAEKRINEMKKIFEEYKSDS